MLQGPGEQVLGPLKGAVLLVTLEWQSQEHQWWGDGVERAVVRLLHWEEVLGTCFRLI